MPKPTSILICGNYGHRTGQIDGQTVKTRVLHKAFADMFGANSVRQLDSSFLIANPLRFFVEARRDIKECSHTIMMPGCRGLQTFISPFLRWKQSSGGQLRYVVVGGWLPDLLARKLWLRQLCSELDGIYVETQHMTDRLVNIGLENVHVLPNFRTFDHNMRRNYTPTTRPIKLVFYSRVTKEKGIEEAIAATHKLNSDEPSPMAQLDVYGPISKQYEKRFHYLVDDSLNIAYKGVLGVDQVHQVLQRYDLMIFPTYYSGEGFPGAIVDALIAGVPILASDWRYNRELIAEGQTGVIIKVRSVDDIVEKIGRFITSPSLIMDMRRHCIAKANEYHSDYVIQQLLSDMGWKS